MLIHDLAGAVAVLNGRLAEALGFTVKGQQRVGNHRVLAETADDGVEFIVHFADMLRVLPGEVEFLQIHHMRQLLQSLRRHVFGGVVGGKSLDPQADVQQIIEIVQRNAEHAGTLAGVLDETLLRETAQRLSNGCAADAELLDELQLRQYLPAGIDAEDDVIFQLRKHAVCKGGGLILCHSGASFQSRPKRPPESSSSLASSS